MIMKYKILINNIKTNKLTLIKRMTKTNYKQKDNKKKE